jgi:hypothetical protein
MVPLMTLMMIGWMMVSMAALRDDGLADWVEKNLDGDVSGYRDRTDEDGLGKDDVCLRGLGN